MTRILVFGASGALGNAVVAELESGENEVLTAGRRISAESNISVTDEDWASNLSSGTKIDGIVWAQGKNSAGSVLTSSAGETLEMFEANVLFIQRTLQELVRADVLNNPCRAVVISSMWQEHARSQKFAYLVSKAAISGLVKSIAIDLAEIGFTINAVLPGVIDTPMTRANLSPEQVENVELNTLGHRLATPQDVARCITWLVSPNSQGLTSQFITVDNGWTINRHV